MEEEGVFDEISGDHSGSDQGTNTIDDHGVHLPVCLAYLSLGFKVISTVIIVLMAGWVIVTIRTTRSLHNIHNIFVAYLMATDIIIALIGSLLTGMMIIGYFTGIGDFIGCNVFVFLFFPTYVMYFTFLMIAVDKVIAVTFPLRYCEIMKPRVVFGIITTIWVLAIVTFTNDIFSPEDSFTKIAKLGACYSNSKYLRLIIRTLPVILASFLTAILNIYLTIKAYQVHKKIQELTVMINLKH